MADTTTTTNKCASVGIYDSLNWCNGKTTLPGIRQRVYFIKKSDILTWPKLPEIEGAKTMKELSSYVGNFVLAADKKWKSLDTLDAKSNIECDPQGDKPSRSYLNKGNLKHAGKDEEAAGFCRQANVDELVYLVQQRNKKFRVLGSEVFDTDTKPTQKSGEGYTGESGTDIAVEATDVCPAPFYPGKIETEDGNISGVDGSAWVEPTVTP